MTNSTLSRGRSAVRTPWPLLHNKDGVAHARLIPSRGHTRQGRTPPTVLGLMDVFPVSCIQYGIDLGYLPGRVGRVMGKVTKEVTTMKRMITVALAVAGVLTSVSMTGCVESGYYGGAAAASSPHLCSFSQ